MSCGSIKGQRATFWKLFSGIPHLPFFAALRDLCYPGTCHYWLIRIFCSPFSVDLSSLVVIVNCLAHNTLKYPWFTKLMPVSWNKHVFKVWESCRFRTFPVFLICATNSLMSKILIYLSTSRGISIHFSFPPSVLWEGSCNCLKFHKNAGRPSLHPSLLPSLHPWEGINELPIYMKSSFLPSKRWSMM